MADEHDPQPSTEAIEAVKDARHARATTEAALPMAEQIRDEVRSVLTSNHFADLMERTLREAARRRAKRWGAA